MTDHSLFAPWRSRAACIGTPTEMWFRMPGGKSIKRLKEICGSCPVREECLDDALFIDGSDDAFGFRAGLSANARQKLRVDMGLPIRKRCQSRDCALPVESEDYCPEHKERHSAMPRGKVVGI